MKKNNYFFNIKRGSWNHIRKIIPDTTLIMLERTMYLAIILLLVQYRFIIDMMLSIMQKWGQ